MSRFLRFCALLSVLFFSTNLFAAGYTCPTTKRYTSCNAGYYLTSSSNGNSCSPCSGAKNTISTQTGTESCTRACSITGGICSYSGSTRTYTNTCSGYYTGGPANNTTVGSGSCTGCSAYSRTSTGTCSGGTISVTCNTGYTKNSAGTACNPNTYKVTLDKQSGTGGTSEYYYQYKTLGSCYYYTTSALTTCIAGTQGITITVPTRTGYTFGGYYTGTNGTGTQYVNASGGTINNLYSASAANITLYAKWTAKSYTCAAGKYLNGTTCTTCTVDYYCPGGTWTYNGGIQGRNACSSYRANTNTNGVTGASSSSSCVCSSGRYLSGSTCTACAKGTYKSAHSNATGCTVASSGYYVPTTGATYQTACTSLGSFYTASDSGRDAASDCYGTTTAGKYIATANTSTQTTCSYGHYCPATKIYYGSTGGREECPSPMAAESGSDAKTDCFVELSGGFYLKAGNSGGTQCPANSFCSGGKFYFNDDSDQGKSSCTANSSSPAGSDAKADCVCNAGYGGSGASGSCTYCSAGTYKTSAGNTSCLTCTSNSYCTGGTHIATCSSSDASYPYSDSGTGSANYCYASKTNTGSQITCSKPANSYSHTCNSCTPGTCSWRDYKGATDTTCTPTNCTQTATVTGCAASYYKSGNACYACSGLANGFYPNSNAGNSSGTSACFTDSLSGKIIKTANASTTETCGAGYYKAAHTVNYGSTSGGCSTVSAGCYSDSAGATSSCPKSCSSLGGGLYKNSAAGSDAATDCYFTTTAGKYLAASTDTAQTTCEAKYYCPATTLYYPNTGSKQSCPDPTSSTYKEAVSEMGWLTTACPTATTSNSSLTSTAWQSWGNTGLSAITQCPAVYNVSTPCANFQIESVKYNSTTGRYDSDVGGRYSTAVKAGYYFTERYSSTYCNTTTNNMLYKTAAKCPANSYCPGATVPKCSSGTYAETYGSYACTSLGSFYTTSAAGATANTSCYGTTTPGNYIATAKSGQVTCAAGGYCPGSVNVYYNSTGGRTACSAGTKNASTGSSSSSACTACEAGTYNTTTGNTSCTTCPAGSYCTGGSNKTACAANSSSAAGSDAISDCSCNAGYSGNAGTSGGSCTACSCGYYKGSAGNTSCTKTSAGYYATGTGNTGQTKATAGNYAAAGACSQSACPSPYSSSAAGSSSNAYCYLTTSSTKYVAETGKGQVTCAAGGYCPGGTTVYYTSGVGSTTGGRTACSAGTKNASTGSSSSSACTACAAGTYSTGGASACSTVSDGCYGGASATTACPNSCSSLNSFYTKSDSSRDASTDCYGTTTSGNYIATAKSGQVTCAAGGYCPGSVKVYYNSTGGRTACSAGTKNASTGSSSSSACTACEAGTYNTTTGNTSCTTCPAGSYCTGGSNKTACGGGKYSSAGATSCSNISAGCYGTSASSACPAVCGENQYSASGSSSCSSCPTDYKNSGTSASSHAGSASCIITVSAGKYIGTAGDNSTNWDTCAGGTYKASHTVAYGSTSSCSTCSAGYYCPAGAGSQTACGSNAKYSSSGAAACSDVSSGYYTTGGGSTTRTGQTKCEAGNYCSGGVKTACGGGKYSSAGATSCSNISAGCYGTSASSSCPAVCGENKYSTAGSSSCSSCPTDYKNSGTSASSHAGSASCIITVSAGKYIGTAGDNSTNWDTCAGGTYKASHTVAYGSTSSCSTCSAGYYCPAGAGSQTPCGSNAKYSSSGAAACSDVSSGYYTTGGGSTTRTGQTKCEAGNYCSGGVKTACGGGKYSSAGATSCSNISAGCYGTSASSSCPAVCGENKYSTSGSSSCSSCPTDYKNSGTSASSHAGSASCIITVSAGKYIGTAGDNSSNWDTCAGGTYKASHTVAYGSTSSCSTCSAGYYCPQGAGSQTACATGSYTNATGKSACTACGAGKTTSGTGKTSCDATCANATGAHSWATPSWSANSVTNLCKVTACNANTYYTAKTATGYTNTCSSCGANSSTSAGNTSTTCACLAGYTVDGKVGGTATTTSAACQLISNIACAIGQYVPAKATACSDCTAGYYCPSTAKTYSYSTSIQGRTACSPGTYQPNTGKTSCVDASAGYYVGSSAATSQTACTGATYAANTKQSSCTPCPAATNNTSDVVSYAYWNTNGKAGDQTTRAGCNATFKAKTLDDGTMSSYSCYVDSGADTYGVDGTSKTCWVNRSALKCNGGYYNTTFNNSSTATQYTVNKTLTNLYANVCTNAGAGYWSANDSLTRTACATGLTTIGYGTAANEADDCGRKLHAGNNVIYLRSAARTTPSLRVKIGDTTFFGALSTTRTGALKVNNGGTEYSVVNDWQ